MVSKMFRVGLIVPTYNGGSTWALSAKSIYEQRDSFSHCLVIDSGSTDGTREIAAKYGFELISIDSKDFDHAGTRNIAAEYLCECDILVFMTQDAILCNSAIEKIVQPFKNESVAAVCGRQIPHDNANMIAAHARFFNYPSESCIKSSKDITRFGIKTAFMSNSFSAYRSHVFFEVGKFPLKNILSEDMFIAAKMILAGYSIAYCATAIVKHSHNYTPREEFNRYFDIGVFHADNKFIMQHFGGAGGEGMKYVISEIKYLLKNAPLLIPKSLYTTLMKFVGFKLGVGYKCLPRSIIRLFSMHKRFWNI